MAYLPELNVIPTSALNTTAFLGLNRGLSIADGEMADMTNMTADQYPVLSTRQRRTLVSWKAEADGGKYTFADPQGIVGTDKLVICDGGAIYVDGVQVEGVSLSTDPGMQPKQLVTMGAYVCIWPDKVYINLANPDDYGPMGASWQPEDDAGITAVMCRKDGTDYDMESLTISDTAPENPANEQLWLDTSGEVDVLNQYSTIYAEWIQVATTYIKLSAPGIGAQFKADDTVFISGARTQAADTAAAINDMELAFPVEDFHLSSAWTTVNTGASHYHTTPTVSERTKTVTVSGIADGMSVSSAYLTVTTTSPRSGAALLTINGQSIAVGETSQVPVTVSGNGEVSLRFRFQANGDAISGDVGSHAGSVTFSDMELIVVTGTHTSAESEDALASLNTSNVLYGCGDNYIIVTGLLRKAVTLSDQLRVELRIPDLDYVCEANNRIWGCCYAQPDGTLVNELHACALGDFRNWYRYSGTSMDSYTVSVGSDGCFTGAYSISGIPIFWKEGCMHRVGGTQPSNFTLSTTLCRGVMEGCWRSQAMVGETLYYRARTDVMAYDGSLPYSVSEKLGTKRYHDAAGGSYRDKYYLCMRDDEMAWHLYVLDTAKGLWHREDASHIRFFATVKGDMYFIQENTAPARLMSVNGLTEDPEESFDWSVTFGVYGYAYETQKYLSRFNIRAQLAAGGRMKMEIMYDSNGEWVDHGEMRCPALRTFMLPVIPRRCDHCQIRLSGHGEAKIYGLARILEMGGDG